MTQNSPQQTPYGLYAEQLSGSAFTQPRRENFKTWLYRLRPSVVHKPFKICVEAEQTLGMDFVITPNQLRWMPKELIPSTESVDFVKGLELVAGQGNAAMREGLAIYNYCFNASMTDKAFSNADGDFLLVPQLGSMVIKTEMGIIELAPGEICVIQRGIKMQVETSEACRGYILEVFDRHFELPELGVIGANGLAAPRHFLHPVAFSEDIERPFEIMTKFQSKFFSTSQAFSPFDVVGWQGNYSPFKYDLSLFNTINTVSFDHPDPSIFTVLTVKSAQEGVALADFVIFPDRWIVAEHTFRPPYFHRNCMSEYMGLIKGKYDGKKEGFVPGGASLHSIMSPHGPDSNVYSKAISDEQAPVRTQGGLAFMFETNLMLGVKKEALERVDERYYECWEGLKKSSVA